MKPGDRLVCAFVEPQPVGSKFKTWLLHVTIVPWFRLSDEPARVAQGLEKALASVSPFEARISEEARFGSKRSRPAHLLEPCKFPEVEQGVRGYLHKKRAWLVDETTKVRRPFRPHVTFQGDTHLHEGDKIYCDRLYIVQQKGDYKEVMAEIRLDATET